MPDPLAFSHGGAIDHTGISPAHPGDETGQPPYVSTKNETVRMFDSDFMEFFSRVHPATPLILYLPVIGFMLYVAIWRQAFPVVCCRGTFPVWVFCSGRCSNI